MQPHIIKTRAAAYRVIRVQLLVVTLVAIFLLAIGYTVAAYSALLGGLSYVGPNAVFVRYALRRERVQNPGMVVRWMLFGEVSKLVLTALLFAVSFMVIKPLSVPALFLMFLAMMLVNMIGMAMIKTE